MMSSKLSVRFISANNPIGRIEGVLFNTVNTVSTEHKLTRDYSALSHKHINQLTPVTCNQSVRCIASQEITKNIQLFSDSPRCNVKDVQSLRLKTPLDKPLVVLLSWLMSKQKHLKKYAQLYTDQGFEVLTVQVTPWQLLWPKKGSQLVAGDVVKFLESNVTTNPLLLHGFSVGGYVWGECMVHMARDTERYKNVLKNFNGQIWDSVADITEISIGVPKAMFPKNYTLQRAVSNYMLYHMKAFHEPATSHYIRASQMFYSTLVKKPALFFLSKSDPIGAVSSNEQLRASWESLGISCDWKCWEKSPHVGHFMKHREEYIFSLHNFLQSLNMVQHPEKMRIRAQN